MKIVVGFLLALSIATPTFAKTVKVIQPLQAGLAGNIQITETRVSLNEATKIVFEKLEAKAAKKREEAGLAPPTPGAIGDRPKPDQYPTLPITQMFPLIVDDQARERGLSAGKNVRLTVTFDTLKTADAGMVLLLGSADQLAGEVNVEDATTGEILGAYYIDILNTRSGLFGLAARGTGVREKLAAEFSKRLIQQLSASKKKRAKS